MKDIAHTLKFIMKIESSSAKATVMFSPDVKVCKGERVFFEVKVVRYGGDVSRIGWATSTFLTGDSDVGCDIHSYCIQVGSYSMCKWHNNKVQHWGQPINEQGDVIGVALDMVHGSMVFGLNGKWDHPMGVAFDDIDTSEKFFLVVCFGDGEIVVNFDESDFEYGPPDMSYKCLTDIV